MSSDPIVPRSQMPQVDEKDIAKLIVFAAKAGYGVTAGEAPPSVFSAHQDIDHNKIEGIAQRPELLSKPILCTKKFEIIDGNHRHGAHVVLDINTPYIMFDMSFVEALNLLAVFPFAYELTPLTPERN